MEINNRNFIGVLKFEKDKSTNPKRGVGVNTLYTRRKGNSYFLLDMKHSRMDDEDATPLWTIHSNVNDFDNYTPVRRDSFFRSDRQIPNEKFLISQFLTLFF